MLNLLTFLLAILPHQLLDRHKRKVGHCLSHTKMVEFEVIEGVEEGKD